MASFTDISQKFCDRNFAILKVAFTSDMPHEIVELYKTHIQKHNDKQIGDYYCDAGFDLFVPKDVKFDEPFVTNYINFEMKTEMLYWDWNKNEHVYYPTAFDMMPRSSITKTPLMMANHIGIIDAGYRGNLIGAFRFLPESSKSSYDVLKETRLMQVCHPTRCPIYVSIVSLEDLSDTSRGSGGFGSTGV